MSAKRKQHIVEIRMNGHRYVAQEAKNKITISRDGSQIGAANWGQDQLLNCTTTALPDDVFHALEKKIKERMDANWDEE